MNIVRITGYRYKDRVGERLGGLGSLVWVEISSRLTVLVPRVLIRPAHPMVSYRFALNRETERARRVR